MSDISRRGRFARGIGDGVISVDAVTPPPLVGVVGGGTQFYDDNEILYQRGSGNRFLLEILNLDTLVARLADEQGANTIVAGGRFWAAWLAGQGYRDSRGHRVAAWHPLAVDKATGHVAVCLNYDAGAGLGIWTGSALVVVHDGPLDRMEASFRNGALCFRAGGHVRIWENGEVRALPALPLQGVEHAGGWLLGWHDTHGLVLYRAGESRGLVVSADGRDFGPKLIVRDDGTILVGSSAGAAELPHEARVYVVDTAAETVNGVARGWVSLGVGVPAPPVQQPGQPPSQVPAPARSVRPWPRPIWVVPYQSFNSVRYGDTTDFVGNAILAIREDKAQTTEQVQAHARRVAAKGYPLVIQPEAFTRDIEALVVGLYLHTATTDILEHEVATTEAGIARRELPDAPLVCYLDGPWPQQPPAGLDPRRHWLSPQCYRNGGESLAAYTRRVETELDRLRSWGFQLIPTTHAYDRNGLGTLAEALEVQALIREWGERFALIGFMPFSDMRRGVANGRPIGGLELYPELKAWVRSLAEANPEGRPNRNSYFVARFASRTRVLRNILGQTRELVHLSQAQKDYILSLLPND